MFPILINTAAGVRNVPAAAHGCRHRVRRERAAGVHEDHPAVRVALRDDRPPARHRTRHHRHGGGGVLHGDHRARRDHRQVRQPVRHGLDVRADFRSDVLGRCAHGRAAPRRGMDRAVEGDGGRLSRPDVMSSPGRSAMTRVIASRRDLVLGASALSAACIGFPGIALAQARPVNIPNAAGAINLAMQELMKSQKFLEEMGLAPNVVNVADGSKIVSSLFGGDMDISTMSGFGQVFPAIERGGKLKILAGAMLLPSVAIFTSKANVRSLKDLEGKIVGSGSPGALVHQLTVALLKKKGVDYKRVQFVNIGSSVDVFRAVTVGTVDAGVGEVTYVEEQEKYKVRMLPEANLSMELTEYTYQGAYASERTIETKRDILVRTLAAYGKLYRFVHKPEAKEAFFKARSAALKKTSENENEILWRYLQKYKPYAANLALAEERLNYMQGLNVELGVQKKVLPFTQVADMSIAREALKMIGGDV